MLIMISMVLFIMMKFVGIVMSTFSPTVIVIRNLWHCGGTFTVWSVIICGFTVILIANFSDFSETWCKVIGILLRFHVKSLGGVVETENLLLWLQGWGYMQNAFVILQILLSSMTTLTTLKMLMTTLMKIDTELAPLLSPFSTYNGTIFREFKQWWLWFGFLINCPYDSDVTQCQPPLVLMSHDIGYLSLPSDSGLPVDVTNGSDLGLGFDSIVGVGLIWLPLQWPIHLQTMILTSTHIHSRRK